MLLVWFTFKGFTLNYYTHTDTHLHHKNKKEGSQSRKQFGLGFCTIFSPSCPLLPLC